MQNISSFLGASPSLSWRGTLHGPWAIYLLIISPWKITEYGNFQRYRDEFDYSKCCCVSIVLVTCLDYSEPLHSDIKISFDRPAAQDVILPVTGVTSSNLPTTNYFRRTSRLSGFPSLKHFDKNGREQSQVSSAYSRCWYSRTSNRNSTQSHFKYPESRYPTVRAGSRVEWNRSKYCTQSKCMLYPLPCSFRVVSKFIVY